MNLSYQIPVGRFVSCFDGYVFASWNGPPVEQIKLVSLQINTHCFIDPMCLFNLELLWVFHDFKHIAPLPLTFSLLNNKTYRHFASSAIGWLTGEIDWFPECSSGVPLCAQATLCFLFS